MWGNLILETGFSNFSFGANTSAPAFGATTTPAFGANTTPAFGVNTSSAFGVNTSTPAFGGIQSTPAFGASTGKTLFCHRNFDCVNLNDFLCETQKVSVSRRLHLHSARDSAQTQTQRRHHNLVSERKQHPLHSHPPSAVDSRVSVRHQVNDDVDIFVSNTTHKEPIFFPTSFINDNLQRIRNGWIWRSQYNSIISGSIVRWFWQYGDDIRIDWRLRHIWETSRCTGIRINIRPAPTATTTGTTTTQSRRMFRSVHFQCVDIWR